MFSIFLFCGFQLSLSHCSAFFLAASTEERARGCILQGCCRSALPCERALEDSLTNEAGREEDDCALVILRKQQGLQAFAWGALI